MRIIHLCLGKANPNRMNGVNTVVHELSSEQVRQGVDVEVWGITPTLNASTPSRRYPLKLYQGSGRQFSIPKGMLQDIENLPSDTIVHIHGILIMVFYSIARTLKKRGIKWVVAPHGAYNRESLKYRAWLKYPFILLIDRFILRHAKAIHISTKSEIDTIHWLCRQTPYALIKNGQNLNDIAFDKRNIPTPMRPVFGFIGRLAYRHKGLDLLIDGFASYCREGGQGALWLIGGGPDQQFLKKRIQAHGIEERVTFFGPQFDNDKFNLIHAMDVFVHTSRWEVMPLSILEAAGFLTPVLLSKATNLGTCVNQWDAGFVLNENTPEMICQTMLTIDQSLDTLPIKGQNARRMIEQEFSWEMISKTLMQEVYKG